MCDVIVFPLLGVVMYLSSSISLRIFSLFSQKSKLSFLSVFVISFAMAGRHDFELGQMIVFPQGRHTLAMMVSRLYPGLHDAISSCLFLQRAQTFEKGKKKRHCSPGKANFTAVLLWAKSSI